MKANHLITGQNDIDNVPMSHHHLANNNQYSKLSSNIKPLMTSEPVQDELVRNEEGSQYKPSKVNIPNYNSQVDQITTLNHRLMQIAPTKIDSFFRFKIIIALLMLFTIIANFFDMRALSNYAFHYSRGEGGPFLTVGIKVVINVMFLIAYLCGICCTRSVGCFGSLLGCFIAIGCIFFLVYVSISASVVQHLLNAVCVFGNCYLYSEASKLKSLCEGEGLLESKLKLMVH
jgi:hypothetical protein